MTGFGSADGKVLGGRLRVEIRTVNHRYYNPQFRLPFELAGIEGQLRERLRQLLDRGHVAVSALGRSAALRRRRRGGHRSGPPGGGGRDGAQEAAQAQGRGRSRLRGTTAGRADRAERRRRDGRLERRGADRGAGGARGARDAGARRARAGVGARCPARRLGDGRGHGRGAGAGAPGGGADAIEEGGGGARCRCAAGRAAAGGGDRARGGPGGHHGRVGPPADAPRRVPRDPRRRGGGRQAARLPRAGAVARGEHHRLEGERCRDHPDRDRDERRAREVSGAAREPGVTPRVVVLSAPSGGGKTTIAKALLARRPDIGYSVSATTRPPSVGEKDGQAYHFLTREEFERRRAAGEVLESAVYAGE